MPNYKTKYKEEWEDQIDISGEKIKKWMHKINEYLVECNICNKEIKVGDLGLSALLRHAKQKKHQKNLERRQVNPSNPSTSRNVSSSNNSNPSTSTSGQLNDTRYEDNATLTEQIAHAEAIWSAIVAEHDLSFLVSDHVSKKKKVSRFCSSSGL